MHFYEQEHTHANEKDLSSIQEQRGILLFHQNVRRIIQELLH